MMSTSEITEKRSSSGSSGSMDSVEKRKSIQRVQSARLRAKRKQKPLVGDRALRTLNRAPLLVKAFLIIVLTGLPFAIFMGFAYTKYPDRTIGENNLHVTYKQLSLWLSIAWASFLIIFTLAEVAGRTGARLCRLSVHTIKYAPLAQTMWFRLTMIAWVGTLHEATCRIWPISEDKTIHGNWVWQLRQAFMFLTIAFSIVFVQGLFLQLIAIQYVEGYVGPRSERADNELDIIRDLNNLIKPHVSDLGLVAKILRRIFMPIESNCFADIRHGQCEDKKVRTYAASIWNTIAGSKSQITMQDITARLVEMDRDPLKAEELFLMLDESCDNHVTREELERLVVKTAIQLRKRAAAMRGIQLLLHKLEVLLTLLVFGIIIFIYSKPSPLTIAGTQAKCLSSQLLPSRLGQRSTCPLDRDRRLVLRLCCSRGRSRERLRLRIC